MSNHTSRPDLVEEKQTDTLVEDAPSAAQTGAALPATLPHDGTRKRTALGDAVTTKWLKLRRWQQLATASIGLVLILFAMLAWQFTPLLAHKTEHFQFADGPQDGQFSFAYAIFAVPSWSGTGRHHFECGNFSSSEFAPDAAEIRTMTFGAIQTASPKRHPLKDALLPQRMPVVQGEISHEFPGSSSDVLHPPNCVVDLSSLNALLRPVPMEFFDQNHEYGLIELESGDYVTNQLTVKNFLEHRGPGKVRIFVEDEAGLPKGITIDGGTISTKHPADFQIWYNGTGRVKLTGVSDVSCTIYAPHADVYIDHEVLFKGAIICRKAYCDGGTVLFDRDLKSIKDWR